MSLLRALRAYVGLGPDDEYDELMSGRGDRRDERRAARSERTRPNRRGGYLDDLEPRRVFDGRAGDDEADAVVDITSARIDAGRADGSTDRRSRTAANHSRIRTAQVSDRRRRLERNEQLLDELGPEPFDGADIDLRDDQHPAGSSDRSHSSDDAEEPEGAIVRSIDSARSRPRTITPETFGDAKEIGDEFKRGTPVVVNLQDLDRDLVRRLVDFASGICYALDGSMEKLAPQVFLLTPDGLDVSDDDRRRIEQRGYAR